MPDGQRTFLIVSQVFVPDPASVGQHIADVAFEMARRGHRVLVYAANRGYENPSVKYPSRETINGVEIRRLPLMWFGKKNLLVRALATGIFHTQALVRGLTIPRLSGILFSTSPPMIGLAASSVGRTRRVPTTYWAMDLNPDQLIALGKITATGLIARTLETVNRYILRHSTLVVALDRFMADRLASRVNLEGRLQIAPPWPHEDVIEPVDPATNPFRLRHDLQDKFVVMYSGNHSPSNPLDTLLRATLHFRDDPKLRFLFVGGGLLKKDIEAFITEHNLTNVISLPYQPLSELRYSLSAADVHVVSLGEGMTGIIHPCKIYGAMAVGRPILYFGPRPSHVTDLLDEHAFGWTVAHGDVQGAIEAIQRIRAMDATQLQHMGQTAARILSQRLSQATLCGQFCDWIESTLNRQPIVESRRPCETSAA